MADTGERVRVDFRTEPSKYRHWKLTFAGPVATLAMDVKEDGGLAAGLRAEAQLLRPRRGRGALRRAPALALRAPGSAARSSSRRARSGSSAPAPTSACCAQSAHGWKVNFCKFTNETRNAIEEATARVAPVLPLRGQRPLRGRRLRARAGDRLDRDGRRRQHGGVAPGGAAARRASGHRGPHPARGQAPGPPRPRGLLLHRRGGDQGRARRRVGTRGRGRAALEARRGREAAGRRARGPHRPAGRRAGHQL